MYRCHYASVLICSHFISAHRIDESSKYTSVCIDSIPALNQIQSQTYLDNYTDDYGNGPLHGATALTWALADNPGARYLFDFQSAYYDKINTTVLSGGIIQRFMLNKQPQTWYAGLDYTKYDDMNFYQFVMANDTQIYGFGSKSRMYLPFGNSQTYAGDFTSTITGRQTSNQPNRKTFRFVLQKLPRFDNLV